MLAIGPGLPSAGPLARQPPFARAAAKLGPPTYAPWAKPDGFAQGGGVPAAAQTRGPSPFASSGGVAGDPVALAPSPGQELPLRPARDRWGQRMNHQRKPRLGLVRPLPLPLDHLLKPPGSFLRNGPIVWRRAVARNGRNAARVSGRNGASQLRIRAGRSACVQTRGIRALEVWLCFHRVTSRRVRSNLNNFIRYSWEVASRTGGNQIPRVLPLSGHLCSSPVRWAGVDGRQYCFRDVDGLASLPSP